MRMTRGRMDGSFKSIGCALVILLVHRTTRERERERDEYSVRLNPVV